MVNGRKDSKITSLTILLLIGVTGWMVVHTIEKGNIAATHFRPNSLNFISKVKEKVFSS